MSLVEDLKNLRDRSESQCRGVLSTYPDAHVFNLASFGRGRRWMTFPAHLLLRLHRASPQAGMLTGALASSSASSTGDPSPLAWAEALKKATEAILHYSGAKAGARTMMDALVPAADAALDAANSGVAGRSLSSFVCLSPSRRKAEVIA